MTTRQQYKMAALAGICWKCGSPAAADEVAPQIAAQAGIYADAMIREDEQHEAKRHLTSNIMPEKIAGEFELGRCR